MSETPQDPIRGVRADPSALPPPKWWGLYRLEGSPPERRFVLRWKRILTVVGSLCVVLYLSLATALWAYYAIGRKIPGVYWIDVAVLPRFSRVQAAIGENYYEKAMESWKSKDYVRAIFTARAAVQKAPANLDARFFLADCWLQVGRYEEAVRALRDGVRFNASDTRLQQRSIATCLQTGRFRDALKLLREDFPAKGVRLLDEKDPAYKLAEIRSVLETSGAKDASEVAAGYRELSALPQAAPLLAGIDLELGHNQAALDLLLEALKRSPSDRTLLNAYANAAKTSGKMGEAQAAARVFLKNNPNLVDAQLCFLEMFGSRKGDDRLPWTEACVMYLKTHQHEPDALARLASLAATEGWTDITFLLYENSLQENLNGFPFAIYYAASLAKVGDASGADSVWHQLSIRNSAQISGAAYVGAMVASGAGRESETMQIIDRLRRETADDPARRRSLETIFRSFGFPKIAEALAANHA